MFARIFCAIALITLAGCYQTQSDDLRAVPTTNNPNVVGEYSKSSKLSPSF